MNGYEILTFTFRRFFLVRLSQNLHSIPSSATPTKRIEKTRKMPISSPMPLQVKPDTISPSILLRPLDVPQGGEGLGRYLRRRRAKYEGVSRDMERRWIEEEMTFEDLTKEVNRLLLDDAKVGDRKDR